MTLHLGRAQDATALLQKNSKRKEACGQGDLHAKALTAICSLSQPLDPELLSTVTFMLAGGWQLTLLKVTGI